MEEMPWGGGLLSPHSPEEQGWPQGPGPARRSQRLGSEATPTGQAAAGPWGAGTPYQLSARAFSHSVCHPSKSWPSPSPASKGGSRDDHFHRLHGAGWAASADGPTPGSPLVASPPFERLASKRGAMSSAQSGDGAPGLCLAGPRGPPALMQRGVALEAPCGQELGAASGHLPARNPAKRNLSKSEADPRPQDLETRPAPRCRLWRPCAEARRESREGEEGPQGEAGQRCPRYRPTGRRRQPPAGPP